MKGVEDFSKDPIIEGLLKSESFIRIIDCDSLQVNFENSALKHLRITADSTLLREANRLKQLDMAKKHYEKTNPTFSCYTVRVEDLYGAWEMEDEEVFNPRIFKLFDEENINPVYIACQKHSKMSEISIFEYESGYKSYCLNDLCRQFIGRIEFSASGLRYSLVDDGLSPTQINCMPEGSFLPKKVLMEAEFETRFFVDKPSYFDVKIFQGEKNYSFTNLRPVWNQKAECYELFFFE